MPPYACICCRFSPQAVKNRNPMQFLPAACRWSQRLTVAGLAASLHSCTSLQAHTHTPRDLKVRHAPDNSGSDPCSVIRLQCKFSQLLKPARLSSVMFAYVCHKKLLPLPLRIGMCVVTWKPPSHTHAGTITSV